MARTLPWQDTSEPAPKRRRITTPKADGGTAEPAHTRLQTSLSSKRPRTGSSRSLSSSPPPPPPPPPQAEAMREGYDADDIWMMVEDEFQTLAHSFTRHLHHAEYKRLMIKAKHDGPRKALPDPAQLSPMPKRAKHKLQRDALSAHQQETLDRILLRKKADANNNNNNNNNKPQVEDPWRGTSLQGLMATGSQERRSLKGLGRMPSSTRAAKGFSRSQAEAGGRNQYEDDDVYDGPVSSNSTFPIVAIKARQQQQKQKQKQKQILRSTSNNNNNNNNNNNSDRRRNNDRYYDREAMLAVVEPNISSRKKRARHRLLSTPSPEPQPQPQEEEPPEEYSSSSSNSSSSTRVPSSQRRRNRQVKQEPSLSPSPPRRKPSLLLQKNKKMMKKRDGTTATTAVSKQDRLAAVPMFIV